MKRRREEEEETCEEKCICVAFSVSRLATRRIYTETLTSSFNTETLTPGSDTHTVASYTSCFLNQFNLFNI